MRARNMIDRADRMLLKAKRFGRDGISAHDCGHDEAPVDSSS